MTFNAVQWIMLKVFIRKVIMLNWRQNLFKPSAYALGISIGLWMLLIISTIYSWRHTPTTVITYKLISICIHTGCLLTICIAVSILTYLIFSKNNFLCWFSSLGFFFYIVAQIIILVNALTIETNSKLKYITESVVVFVLLFLYTQMISWQNRIYKESQRRFHEEYVDMQISSRVFPTGRCIRIALKGPMMVSSASSQLHKPGPSSSR